MTKLTPIACRAARACLGLTTQEAAAKLGVSPTTINAIEQGKPFRDSTGAALIEAFERLGVEILNGDSPGARLRPPRGDIHEAFEELVTALAYRRELPDDPQAILRDIEASPRVSADLLPGGLARDLRDLDPEGRRADTYGEAVPILRDLLSE